MRKYGLANSGLLWIGGTTMARTVGTKEPVRDLQKIRQMKEWLLVNKTYRDYFLLFLGLNTGLRISDLLRLRVMDVRNKNEIKIITKKTEREITIPLNGDVQFEIKKFIENKNESDFLFQSREGNNSSITAVQADRILKVAAEACEINSWGTHSMRKSFGYHYYKKNKDVFFLMNLYGHSSQHQTLKYIGITQDQIRDSLEGFIL